MTEARHTILVIDDERVVCDAVTRHLEQAGFSAHTAYNGTAALEFLESHSVDLALIDIRMPKISGFDVLETIISRHPSTRAIMMTSYADIKSAVDAISMGAMDIISKPIDLDEVLLVIHRCLSKLPLKDA